MWLFKHSTSHKSRTPEGNGNSISDVRNYFLWKVIIDIFFIFLFQNNLANPLQRSKVSPMPLNLTSTQQQQHDDNARTSANNTTTPPTTSASLNSTPSSEFVIFPRELHVESRAPHNRIVSTVDSSYADRRYTMV